jgi:hypothetical protein
MKGRNALGRNDSDPIASAANMPMKRAIRPNAVIAWAAWKRVNESRRSTAQIRKPVIHHPA